MVKCRNFCLYKSPPLWLWECGCLFHQRLKTVFPQLELLTRAISVEQTRTRVELSCLDGQVLGSQTALSQGCLVAVMLSHLFCITIELFALDKVFFFTAP